MTKPGKSRILSETSDDFLKHVTEYLQNQTHPESFKHVRKVLEEVNMSSNKFLPCLENRATKCDYQLTLLAQACYK